MHTMSASTPVKGPSRPSARKVRPPAVSVRRVRDGENFIEDHDGFPLALSASG